MRYYNNIEYDRLNKLSLNMLLLGKERGPFAAWHYTNSSYNWAIAEILLRRTTRTAAEKAYNDLLKIASNWHELSLIDYSTLLSCLSWIGLGKQRAATIIKLSTIVTDKYNGRLPVKRNVLKSLPGLGEYISDAILLYAYYKKTFPIDPNIQRLIRRINDKPMGKGTRHNQPYKDPAAINFAKYVKNKYEPGDIINIHRGILIHTWEICRPSPNCQLCFFKSFCLFQEKNDN